LPTSFGKSQECLTVEEEKQPDLEAPAPEEVDAATTLSALERAMEALEQVVNLDDADVDWDQLSKTLSELAATSPAVAQILQRHGWIPPSGGFSSTPNIRQLLDELAQAFTDLGGKKKEDKRRRKKDWKKMKAEVQLMKKQRKKVPGKKNGGKDDKKALSAKIRQLVSELRSRHYAELRAAGLDAPAEDSGFDADVAEEASDME